MIEKIGGQYSIDKLAGIKAKKGYASGVNSESDEASFSSFSVVLSRVSGDLKNISDVRQGIVDDLKQKVENGTYNPSLEKIAYNLFMAGIMGNKE